MLKLFRDVLLVVLFFNVLVFIKISIGEEVFSVFNPFPEPTKTADGKWTLHDPNRPLPPKAEPKSESELLSMAATPANATVLFSGEDLNSWYVPQKWVVNQGVFSINPVGDELRTRESFGSCRLHLEWRVPSQTQGSGQSRGNSGVFIMGLYEIQVLDTHTNTTYADGMAGALYGVKPPDFNSLRPTGEWNYYDIWFRRPLFGPDGKMTSPATVTVYVNGVLVQNNVPFEGPSSYQKKRPYFSHGNQPLVLQYHGCVVEFRNVWIEKIDNDDVISPAGRVEFQSNMASSK